MIIEQKLGSGIILKQNLSNTIRMVLYETNYTGWEYATYGGTIFLVNYENTIYGITCLHVKQDFDWNQLFITDKKFGELSAGIKGIYSTKNSVSYAKDSEINDVCVIEFDEESQLNLFGDDPYILKADTIATSKATDILKVFGCLEEKTSIGDKKISPTFCNIEFEDKTKSRHDITLRSAEAKFEKNLIKSLNGISGSPVYNQTQNALSGIVTRGGINNNSAKIHFVDFYDVMQIIKAAFNGTTKIYYEKEIPI